MGKRVVITGSGLADANDEAVIGYAPRHGGEIRSSRRHCVAIGYSTQNANNRTSFDSVPTLQDKVVLLQGWRAQLKQAMPAMRVNKVQIMGKATVAQVSSPRWVISNLGTRASKYLPAQFHPQYTPESIHNRLDSELSP